MKKLAALVALLAMLTVTGCERQYVEYDDDDDDRRVVQPYDRDNDDDDDDD